MDGKNSREKVVLLDNNYAIIEDEKVIETKHCVSIYAMALYQDLRDYRKGNKGLKEQIELEIQALNAFTEAAKSIQ